MRAGCAARITGCAARIDHRRGHPRVSADGVVRACRQTTQMRCTAVMLVSTARIQSAQMSSGAMTRPITVITTRSGRASSPPSTVNPAIARVGADVRDQQRARERDDDQHRLERVMAVEDEIGEQRHGRHRLGITVHRRVEECAVPLFLLVDARERPIENVESARESRSRPPGSRYPNPPARLTAHMKPPSSARSV